MSFNELSIMITAQNLATAEFVQVSSDAGAMATQISAVSNSVSVLGSDFSETSAQAQNLCGNIGQSSKKLQEMGESAQGTSVKLSTVARGISSVSGLGLGLTTLAGDFGLVDSQTTKYMRTTLAIITVISEVARLINISTILTSGHAAAVAVDTTTQQGSSIATIASAAAHQVYATACGIATAAENALNISHATFLALTGVGIGVIVAAAAAMAYFASQMNSATASVKGFNASAAALPSSTGSVTSNAALIRRGAEALG